MKVVITDRSFDDIDLERAILERAGCTVVDTCSKDPTVLAAAVAKKMGYRNMFSLIGGYKDLLKSQWPMKSGA